MSWLSVSLIAIGGMLMIEGAVWAIIPTQMRRLYQEAFQAGDRWLHISGLASVAIGIILLMWGVRQLPI